MLRGREWKKRDEGKRKVMRNKLFQGVHALQHSSRIHHLGAELLKGEKLRNQTDKPSSGDKRKRGFL